MRGRRHTGNRGSRYRDLLLDGHVVHGGRARRRGRRGGRHDAGRQWLLGRSRRTGSRPGQVAARRAAHLRREDAGRAAMKANREPKLTIDPRVVAEARRLASQAGRPIVDMAKAHTTVSVERAVLRLAGLAGADAEGMPLGNPLVEAVRGQPGLEHGIALPVWDALRTGGYSGLDELAIATAGGRVSFRLPEGTEAVRARATASAAVAAGLDRES